MGKPHGQGRYAALRPAVAGLRTVQLSILLAGVLLCSPVAWALDPALDVSQYAHTAWKVRDGFTKGSIFAFSQSSRTMKEPSGLADRRPPLESSARFAMATPSATERTVLLVAE